MKKLSEIELALKKIATVVQDRLSTKQDALTAGTGITIAQDGTISATGSVDMSNYVLKSDTVGLLNNDGTVNTSSYAGGTAVTLNGTSVAGSTASFYAPTGAGTSGQYLKSSGSGAPAWANFPSSLPASDVSSWAKAANKPSYGYGEISYGVNVASVSGAVTISGTTPLHYLTVTANVSSVSLNPMPAAGHSCHVIFTASSAKTVNIATHSTRLLPNNTDLSLSIPANGYVEVDFLYMNNKLVVRGC